MIERVVIDVDQKKVTQDQPADRSASLDAVRSHRLRRHLVRRAVERRQQGSGVRLDVARSQARGHARRRRRDRRRPERPVGAGRDVLRVGPGPRQLALPAADEGSAVVSRARTTGGISICTTPATGLQKNRITTGDGNVTQVLRIDEAGAHDLLPGRRQGERAAIRTSATSTRSASTERGRRC